MYNTDADILQQDKLTLQKSMTILTQIYAVTGLTYNIVADFWYEANMFNMIQNSLQKSGIEITVASM